MIYSREKAGKNRIYTYDLNEYSADKVVFQPKQMSPERLQELLAYAWDAFYQDEPQELKMFKLLKKVVRREMDQNTYRSRNRDQARIKFGKEGNIP